MFYSSFHEWFSNPVNLSILTCYIVVFVMLIMYFLDKRKETEAKRKFTNLLERIYNRDVELLKNLKFKPKKLYINLMEFGKAISYVNCGEYYAILVRTGLLHYNIIICKSENAKVLENCIHVTLHNISIVDNYIGESDVLKKHLDKRLWEEYSGYLIEKIGEISDGLIEGNVITQNELKYLRELIEYEISKKLKPYADMRKIEEDKDGLEYFKRRV